MQGCILYCKTVNTGLEERLDETGEEEETEEGTEKEQGPVPEKKRLYQGKHSFVWKVLLCMESTPCLENTLLYGKYSFI